MNNLFLYSLLGFLFLNCNNENNDADVQNCATVFCTQNFVTLNVSVTDANDNSVLLEEFTITDETSGMNITAKVINSGAFNGTAVYPLYHDGFVSETQNSSSELSFKGYIDGNEIVNAAFTVSTDCCHVSLSSGNTTIVIP